MRRDIVLPRRARITGLSHRRQSAAAWAAENPVLRDGELGLETDARKMKVGDGVTPWTGLAYWILEGPQGPTGLKGDTGSQGPPGPDLWLVSHLAADFSTASTTAVDTGIELTLAANTTYRIEANLLLRTANLLALPRPGLAWPNGMSRGAAQVADGAAVEGDTTAPILGATASVLVINTDVPAFIRGTCRTGASPSGTLRVQLASGLALMNVTMGVGSYLSCRPMS